MVINVPTSWADLTQEQLRQVLALYARYGEEHDGMQHIRLAALQQLAGFSFISRSDGCWLCQTHDGRRFLLRQSVVPTLAEPIEWVEHPEDMATHATEMNGYPSCGLMLEGLAFGRYLQTENYYQDFLYCRKPEYLRKMALLLYGVPDGKEFPFEGWKLPAVFFWYAYAKRQLAIRFPHFLKHKEGTAEPPSAKAQMEAVMAQVRLLTKGDVTKNNIIMETPTWDALAELDALARESEDMKRK